MIKEAFATDETIALAKQKAIEILGAEEKNIEFEIIQSPERKKFGLFGGKLAQVRAFIKDSKAEKAKNYIKEILYYMDLESLDVEIESEGKDFCAIKIVGDSKDIKNVIGYHGETLDAIQYLAGIVANNSSSEPFCKVRVEAGDYREKRKKSLEAFARRKAYDVAKSRERLDLEPMRAYERKILHSAIQHIDGVQSWSEGQNEGRHVVIAPKNT